MKRLIKITGILFLAGVVVLAVLLLPYFNGKTKLTSILHHYVWGNVLKVNVDDNLEKSKVKIFFENEAFWSYQKGGYKYVNKHNQPIHTLIYEDGRQVNDIPYDYGKQCLAVYYDGVRLGELGHWQTNGNYSHRYYINIVLKEGSPAHSGLITGPDMVGWQKNKE